MRIIAGEYRGRKLNTPADYRVRPTSDKVREAMFSILMNDVAGAVVCDPFAGTGALGLEALSRGAEKCYFGDHSGESIKMIRENISICRAEAVSEVTRGDWKKTLAFLREKVDIFILDPPYEEGLYIKVLEEIKRADVIAPEGLVVCEHSAGTEMDEECAGFKKIKERKYGKTVLTIYENDENAG